MWELFLLDYEMVHAGWDPRQVKDVSHIVAVVDVESSTGPAIHARSSVFDLV